MKSIAVTVPETLKRLKRRLRSDDQAIHVTVERYQRDLGLFHITDADREVVQVLRTVDELEKLARKHLCLAHDEFVQP